MADSINPYQSQPPCDNPPHIIYETIPNHALTDTNITQASHLFSTQYSIWSSNKQQIKMGPKTLGAQVHNNNTILVRALHPGTKEIIGHVFAIEWPIPSSLPAHKKGFISKQDDAAMKLKFREYQSQNLDVPSMNEILETVRAEKVVWITQLVVHSSYHRQGVATSLLGSVKAHFSEWRYGGVLSSHPATIRAVARAFGGVGIEEIDLEATQKHARRVLEGANVAYVRDARPRGSLFDTGEGQVKDGSVACADTGFHVDHAEPEEALKTIEAEGKKWKLGDCQLALSLC